MVFYAVDLLRSKWRVRKCHEMPIHYRVSRSISMREVYEINSIEIIISHSFITIIIWASLTRLWWATRRDFRCFVVFLFNLSHSKTSFEQRSGIETMKHERKRTRRKWRKYTKKNGFEVCSRCSQIFIKERFRFSFDKNVRLKVLQSENTNSRTTASSINNECRW